MYGNLHLRGNRIHINSTITANRLWAPILIAVYGATLEEIPTYDSVTITVPGLTIGSHWDVYSKRVGFIAFVCGNYEPSETVDIGQPNNTSTTSSITVSKGARLAEIHKKKVYHSFLFHIQKTYCGWPGNVNDIPKHLQAASLMGVTCGQLSNIASEENMILEELLRITCMKYSRAWTGVEQAINCGPIFKQLKSQLKSTDAPNHTNSPIYSYLDKQFSLHLSVCSSDSICILNLAIHKRKAALVTTSKLPMVTAKTYSIENNKKRIYP